MRLARFVVPLVAALAACNDPNLVVGELQDTIILPAIPNRDLDLLFVIDDSPSMLDKQFALAAAFPQMIDVLSQLDDGLPNLHIGVVTSDMGTSASESPPGPTIGAVGLGGCTGVGLAGALRTMVVTSDGAPYLVDIEVPGGDRERNYDGALRDAFTMNARVGAGGCGFEQHFSAMSHAFDHPANTGFLRPEANLAVVILADEDDCSARNASVFGPESAAFGALTSFRCFRFGVTCDQDSNEVGAKTNCQSNENSQYIDAVQPYIDRLIALKGDERRVMVGVVAGNTAPTVVELRPPPGGGAPQQAIGHSCSIEYPTGPAVADPAIRLKTFIEGFEGRATFTSVCSPDLSAPLQEIGSTAKRMIGDPCLDSARLADVSTAPGVQPSCEVLDIPDSAPTTPMSLAECSSGAPDCYEIVADRAACPTTADHLRIRLNRTSAVTADTWTHVRCKRAE
ncbi:MAG: hypothetical protein ACKV2T_08485 [Kofleriaceae bacterium]